MKYSMWPSSQYDVTVDGFVYYVRSLVKDCISYKDQLTHELNQQLRFVYVCACMCVYVCVRVRVCVCTCGCMHNGQLNITTQVSVRSTDEGQ